MQDSLCYLIPFDFTDVSMDALSVGLDLATRNNGKVYLLHIVKKKAEINDVDKKFKDLLKTLSPENQGKIITKTIEGNLYEDTAKTSSLLNAKYIIMGTHGAVGLQKIFGSKAVKMIASSPTPFIIVQEKKSFKNIDTIVMPFSFDKESIQILNVLADLAHDFDATIHLAAYHDSDEWLNGRANANQLIAVRHLKERGVKYKIVNLDKAKTYEKDLMDYCVSVNAQIIATTYFDNNILPSPNSFIQEMIENKYSIPVITINAEQLTVGSQYSFLSV